MTARIYLRFRWRCKTCLAYGSFSCPPEMTCDRLEAHIHLSHSQRCPTCEKLRYVVERLENEVRYEGSEPAGVPVLPGKETS